MNSADYDRFRIALTTAAAVYGHKLDDAQMRFYWDCLADRPIDDVEKRLRTHAQRGRFMPKPRDLRPLEAYSEAPEPNLAKDAKFQQGQTFNRETWRRAVESDPEAARRALAEALWARYAVESDQGSGILAAKREWLAGRYAALGGNPRNLVPPAPGTWSLQGPA